MFLLSWIKTQECQKELGLSLSQTHDSMLASTIICMYLFLGDAKRYTMKFSIINHQFLQEPLHILFSMI